MEKVVRKYKLGEAQHIEMATVNNFDILLSWNFKHLANINRRQKVRLINERENYNYPLEILTPLEVIYEKD